MTHATTHRNQRRLNHKARKFAARAEQFQNELASLLDELRQATEDAKHRPKLDEEDKRQLLLSFAKLLSEPRYAWELKKTYVQRANFNPIFLGVVRL